SSSGHVARYASNAATRSASGMFRCFACLAANPGLIIVVFSYSFHQIIGNATGGRGKRRDGVQGDKGQHLLFEFDRTERWWLSVHNRAQINASFDVQIDVQIEQAHEFALELQSLRKSGRMLARFREGH